MRKLIFSDGNGIGLVQQNVAGLQNGVSQKTIGRQISIGNLFLFFLVRRIAFQPRNGRDHGKQEMQNRVIRVGRLNEDRRFLRIDSDGQPIDQHLVHEFPDPARIGIVCRQRMPIRHKEKAFVLVL